MQLYLALGSLVVFLLANIGSFFYGQHVANAECQAAQVVAQDQARKEFDRKLVEANEHAADLEKENAAIRANTRVVTRTVDKIVERPVYRNVCLDADGLRAVRDALGLPSAAPAEPPGSVSGPAPARGRDGSHDAPHPR